MISLRLKHGGPGVFILDKGVIEIKKHYGFIHLVFDLFMTIVTGGLWLVWLLIKFLRNGSV